MTRSHGVILGCAFMYINSFTCCTYFSYLTHVASLTALTHVT